MRRMTRDSLLLGCFVAAGCVAQPVKQGDPVPTAPASGQRLLVDTASRPVDMGWTAGALRPPGLLRPIPRDPAHPDRERLYYKTFPYTSLGAHRHSADMRIKVLTGRQFILMGDLETARVQRFDPGTTFVIPAGVWHVEWFESETLVEIEIAAGWTTEAASPATPRVP